MSTAESPLWRMRYLIYQGFAHRGEPPSLDELAAELCLSEDDALSLLRELHARHAVFLASDGRSILMANPFSAVPTPFQVTANGVDCWANCAWDMLGIPAALGADATIQARWATDGATTELRVEDGEVHGEGIVHFLAPFRAWYDDLIHT